MGYVDGLRRGGVAAGVIMDLLTPKIADITVEGLSLTGNLTGTELGLDDTDLTIRGTVAFGLDLRTIERTIYVTGVVEGTVMRQCVRCLKEFSDPIAFSVRAAYERAVKTSPSPRESPRRKKDASGVESEREYLNDDLYYYMGDHLELTPMLREQLILVSPMHPLCTEECRGLCDRCGKDLNEGPCHCTAEPGRGPFGMLRDAKAKLGGSAER